MSFFEKFNIEKFNEIERDVLLFILDEKLSELEKTKLIDSIELFGYIKESKKIKFFGKLLFNFTNSRSIKPKVREGLNFIENQKSAISFDLYNFNLFQRIREKEGFLLLISHHTRDDGPYLSMMLSKLGRKDLPIFIRDLGESIDLGLALPVLRMDEIRRVYAQFGNLDDVKNAVREINRKILICAKLLMKNFNRVIVLAPEGRRRDSLLGNNTAMIKPEAVKLVTGEFLDFAIIGVIMMDETERFGEGIQYIEGKREFDLIDLNSVTDLKQTLEKHFKLIN